MNPKKKEIKILYLENELPLVKLVKKLLAAEGYIPNLDHVQTREEFIEALQSSTYDLILSDYILPDFSGLEALQIVRAQDKITPFILFSGSIGEEKAIEALRNGASDYVFKEQIRKLVSAMEKAIKSAQLEREKEKILQTLKHEKEQHLFYLDVLNVMLVLLDTNGNIQFVNNKGSEILGYTKDELIGKNWFEICIPEPQKEEMLQVYEQVMSGEMKDVEDYTNPVLAKDGTLRTIKWHNGLLKNEAGKITGSLSSGIDITRELHQQNIQQFLFNMTQAGESTNSLEAYLQALYKELGQLIDIQNVFIGLYNKSDNTLSMPYMQDINDRFENIAIDHTYSEWVIKNKKSLLLRGKELAEFALKHKLKRVGTTASCWMGVPLMRNQTIFGIIVIQSYEDESAYNEEDLQLLEFVAGRISGTIERKQLYNRLLQLSRSIEQSPVSIVITDLKGSIEYVNPKFEKITGYTLTEALGQNPRILKSGETPAEEYKVLWDTISSGKTWHGRFHNRRKDGTLFWEEASIGPVLDDSGKPLNYIAIKEDITQLKQTEDAFKRISLENEQLLQALTSVLIVLNKEGIIVRWNKPAENIFGISQETALGKKLLDTGIGWDQSAISEAIAKSRSKNKIVSLTDITVKDMNGQTHFLNMSITTFAMDTEDVSGSLILADDVTNWKEIQSQLTQAQKLESVGQLASGIAHEINTPIQFIGDNIRFLKDAFFDIKELLEFFSHPLNEDALKAQLNTLSKKAEEIDLAFLLEDIPDAIEQSIEGVQRVAKIVKTMKEFTHPNQKAKTPVDINKALSDTILISKNEWKYVADIETDFEENLPRVPGFLGELNQVFLNIIVNASHAIGDVIDKEKGEKGTISIRTHSHKGHVMVEIKDTGTGIKKEHIGSIFNPFFTTKEVGKGTGQGLTLSHAIITQKHNGRIWVETKEGQGTTFFIELPLDE